MLLNDPAADQEWFNNDEEGYLAEQEYSDRYWQHRDKFSHCWDWE